MIDIFLAITKTLAVVFALLVFIIIAAVAWVDKYDAQEEARKDKYNDA